MACATPLIRSSALTEEIAVPTMFEKIWNRHVVTEGPGGQSLLYIDRHLLHEGATHAFARLHRAGRSVRRPAGLVATADHYRPPGPGAGAPPASWPPRITTCPRDRDRRPSPTRRSAAWSKT